MGSDITDIKEAKPIKAIRDPKRFIKKQTRSLQFPEFPSPEELPESPEFDASRDALLRQALIERIMRQTARTGGKASRISTSPQGIVDRLPVMKRRLREAAV